MPKSMRVRIVTRDITPFPHRDLENVPLQTELQVFWGSSKLPTGYVTVLDLGYRHLDFGNGLDLTEHEELGDAQPEDGILDDDDEGTDDTSRPPSASNPAAPPLGHRPRARQAARKATRRGKGSVKAYGRRRGAREDEPA